MYKEHISSDSDYDSVQAFAQHKVPGLFVIFAMPSPCLYFLPNLGPDQRCRGCVRAAAVILIRGELTILSPLVSFGSVCWLIGHSAPPTAPPRRSQKPNSREFSHFKDIKIWKLAAININIHTDNYTQRRLFSRVNHTRLSQPQLLAIHRWIEGDQMGGLVLWTSDFLINIPKHKVQHL